MIHPTTEEILVPGEDVGPEEEGQGYPQTAYAPAIRIVQLVEDFAPYHFLFGEAGRAAKLQQALLRFSQRSSKFLRITLLPDRDVESRYPPVYGQRLVPR